jgi:hypothetical protein
MRLLPCGPDGLIQSWDVPLLLDRCAQPDPRARVAVHRPSRCLDGGRGGIIDRIIPLIGDWMQAPPKSHPVILATWADGYPTDLPRAVDPTGQLGATLKLVPGPIRLAGESGIIYDSC